LENDIHRAANAVLNKQFRGSKPLLVFEVVRNNGLAGAQGVASGRGQIGSDTCGADNSFIPANSRTNQKPFLGRNVFQYLAVFRPQPFGCHTGGMIEHIDEARALQGQDSKFGKEFLLTNAQTESATG
jgi:hypothetical protein